MRRSSELHEGYWALDNRTDEIARLARESLLRDPDFIAPGVGILRTHDACYLAQHNPNYLGALLSGGLRELEEVLHSWVSSRVRRRIFGQPADRIEPAAVAYLAALRVPEPETQTERWINGHWTPSKPLAGEGLLGAAEHLGAVRAAEDVIGAGRGSLLPEDENPWKGLGL